MEQVVNLNLNGTLRPAQIFGEVMAEQKSGSIINISSMSAQKPLTRVIGYSAAKAAVANLTRWLAVELAKKFGEGLRVNAIAPGFFLGEQNRALLINKDQSLTSRGQTIIDHTPMGRFGQPDDLVGTAVCARERCRPLRYGSSRTGRRWFFSLQRRVTCELNHARVQLRVT